MARREHILPSILREPSRAEQQAVPLDTRPARPPLTTGRRLLERLKGIQHSVEPVSVAGQVVGERRISRQHGKERVEHINAEGHLHAVTTTTFDTKDGKLSRFTRETADGQCLRVASRFVDSLGVETLNVYDLDPRIGSDLKYALENNNFTDGQLESKVTTTYLQDASGQFITEPAPLVEQRTDEQYSKSGELNIHDQIDNHYNTESQLLSSRRVRRDYATSERKYEARTETDISYQYHEDGSVEEQEDNAYFGGPNEMYGGTPDGLMMYDSVTQRRLEHGQIVSEVKDLYTTRYEEASPAQQSDGVHNRRGRTLVDVTAAAANADRIRMTYFHDHPEYGTFAIREKRRLFRHSEMNFRYDDNRQLIERVKTEQGEDVTNTNRTKIEYNSSGQPQTRTIYNNDQLIAKISYQYDPTIQVYRGRNTQPMVYMTIDDHRTGTRTYYRSWNPGQEEGAVIDKTLRDDEMLDLDAGQMVHLRAEPLT